MLKQKEFTTTDGVTKSTVNSGVVGGVSIDGVVVSEVSDITKSLGLVGMKSFSPTLYADFENTTFYPAGKEHLKTPVLENGAETSKYFHLKGQPTQTADYYASLDYKNSTDSMIAFSGFSENFKSRSDEFTFSSVLEITDENIEGATHIELGTMIQSFEGDWFNFGINPEGQFIHYTYGKDGTLFTSPFPSDNVIKLSGMRDPLVPWELGRRFCISCTMKNNVCTFFISELSVSSDLLKERQIELPNKSSVVYVGLGSVNYYGKYEPYNDDTTHEDIIADRDTTYSNMKGFSTKPIEFGYWERAMDPSDVMLMHKAVEEDRIIEEHRYFTNFNKKQNESPISINNREFI